MKTLDKVENVCFAVQKPRTDKITCGGPGRTGVTVLVDSEQIRTPIRDILVQNRRTFADESDTLRVTPPLSPNPGKDRVKQ